MNHQRFSDGLPRSKLDWMNASRSSMWSSEGAGDGDAVAGAVLAGNGDAVPDIVLAGNGDSLDGGGDDEDSGAVLAVVGAG
jgi:hypothetical protein